jgi:hypothetical protein
VVGVDVGVCVVIAGLGDAVGTLIADVVLGLGVAVEALGAEVGAVPDEHPDKDKITARSTKTTAKLILWDKSNLVRRDYLMSVYCSIIPRKSVNFPA